MTLLDNELKHPGCHCHQCTWLKARQFERSFIPNPGMCGCPPAAVQFGHTCKPTPTETAIGYCCDNGNFEDKHICQKQNSKDAALANVWKPKDAVEKCKCFSFINHENYSNCQCHCHKPNDAVEEKIVAIMKHIAFPTDYYGRQDAMKHEEELRDLVRLARETK